MNKVNKILFFVLCISIILNIALGVKFFKKLYWVYFEKEPFVTYNYGRDELFKTFNTETTDIIFLGNSITQHFELFELLQDTRVRNRGIGGDSVLGALQRIESITDGKPSKIFIMLGINDLISGRTNTEILNNYKKLISVIKNSSPSTQIYIESVLPVSNHKDTLICCENANQRIIEINQQLKDIATHHSLKYVDLHTSFYKNGGINMGLTVDGIHLNGDGYALLSKQLKQFLD
nr:GDSL-type esterase/lipase family protein [uncultured Psychroserpens sp.]